MVEVYTVRVDEPVTNEQYQHLISYTSKEKRSRIKRFYFIEDAKRTLYGDVLIRYLACQKIQTNNDRLVFCYNQFGKPYLQDYPNFHFNISHSGYWVVCAVSSKEVGIDIEQIKPINLDIAKRFFSDNEY